MRTLITALSAAAAMVAVPASASVIFFDSFEAPDVADWAVFSNAGDNGDWSVVDGAGIEIQQSGVVVQAFAQEQYVELDSDTSRGGANAGTNTTMAANVAFVAGQQYRITFAYRPRTNGANDNGIELFVGEYDGVNLTNEANLTTVFAQNSVQTDWLPISVLYTAMADVDALGFRAVGDENSLGGFIDAVSVSAVPLPAGVLLFGTGLAGLSVMRRKGRKA